MLPKYTYTDPPSLSLIKCNSYKKFFQEYKIYFFRYFLPNLFGDIIDKSIGRLLSNKFVFIRANADHFGNWLCVLLYMRSQPSNSKKIYFVLGKRNTIDNYWLKYFNYKNLKIIYNPFIRILLLGFFFSTRVAIDVNGHIACYFSSRDYFYKYFRRMQTIDNGFLNNYKINIPESTNINIQFFKRPYILFYSRTGKWLYSKPTSKRNMSDENKRKIIKSIDPNYNIFLIGDTDKNLIEDFTSVYDINDFKDKNIELGYIYSKASCVIGSISGATHFPSLIFNLPTLYIGNLQIEQLGPIYLYPKKIPLKDKWLILSNNQLRDIDNNQLMQFIEQFIKFKSLSNIKDVTSYKYISNQKGEYKLIKEKNQNLFIHDKLNAKLYGIQR